MLVALIRLNLLGDLPKGVGLGHHESAVLVPGQPITSIHGCQDGSVVTRCQVIVRTTRQQGCFNVHVHFIRHYKGTLGTCLPAGEEQHQ